MNEELLIAGKLEDVVIKYAQNAKKAGLDGVVCSPLESGMIHDACGDDFVTVTPGVRFADSAKDDQVRITTPEGAKKLGSDYIVVGRPITKAEDPVVAYERCLAMKREIAEGLLSIEAVFLRPDEPFTWASGIKSPIYCDNRLTLTAPAVRTMIEEGLAETVRNEYPDCEVLMGTSTAGIAHAAITGHILNMPMGYVRGSAKDHGRTNRIEGRLEKGQKVVVIEDLISTAGSACDTVEALREAGAEVLGIASIFTYGMKKGIDRLSEHNVRNVSLCDLDTLVEVAAETGRIAKDDIERILKFRDNPSNESWMKEER